MEKIISDDAILNRNLWINKIGEMTGQFAENSNRILIELYKEFLDNGVTSVLNHLRLCGNIPESYGHDTTEEKQYSKYTDGLIAYAFKELGLRSEVLVERADVADVDVYGTDFSFVADAKAFRLSRTAKNQKDFKIQAMDRWKHGKPYATVVCPIYQLPSTNSQIYLQAITRDVCILTYSHISLLVRFAYKEGKTSAEELLHTIFKTVSALHPSKSAGNYWLGINKTILNFSDSIRELWKEEKIASSESLEIGKLEALNYLASKNEKIMRMTHEEAIRELIKVKKINNKIRTIQRIADNGLFGIGIE